MSYREWNRRQFMTLGAGLLGTSLLTSCTSPSTDTQKGEDHIPGSIEQPNLTIAFLPITCASPLVTAVSRGIFSKYGLNVTLKKYSGWADVWSSYAAGELVVSHMLAPMPLAIHHGFVSSPIPTTLALIQNTNGQGITLSKKYEGRVKHPSDFRGMSLAIPFDYSIHNFLLRDYLSTGGLDLDRDVELRIMRPADMVANLATNNIDGYLAPEPFNQRAFSAGYGFLFSLTSNMWNNHPCCCIAVNNDWKEDHPHTYHALCAAIKEAAQWTDHAAHRLEAADSMSPMQFLNQDPLLLRTALTGSPAAAKEKEPVSPELAAQRIRFHTTPDISAGMWLGTQMQRWGLGSLAPDKDTPMLHKAVADVCETPVNSSPDFLVNGRVFSASNPWPWTEKVVPL